MLSGSFALGVDVGTVAIDHLVLPVAGLAQARLRLASLGFTVAADGVHPFGTANACVFLADGTYLEPLAMANRRVAGTAAKRGNTFVARDLAFRGLKNREGLSAIVLASDDAAADHQRFSGHGISAGPMLEFSRPMTMPDGAESEGKFRLAFAADPQVSDFFLFACQRMVAFPTERGDLERHANAVTGLSEIVLSSEAPGDFVGLFSDVLGAEPAAGEDLIGFSAANAGVRLMSSARLEAEFGLPSHAGHGRGGYARASARPPVNGSAQAGVSPLAAHAVIFKSADLAVTEITLAANDVAFVRREGRVLVLPAPGQGVVFGFEE